MKNPRTIESTAEYDIIQADYNNTVNTFRRWHTGLIEVKFNQEWAVANGYKSIADMLEQQPQICYQINMYCGGITPEWIAIVNGEFMIKTNIQAN